MDLDLLKESVPFKWRVQNFSKSSNTAVCVAYIDSRDVMDMLDATVGQENWQSDYKEIKGNLYAGVGIKIKEEWVWKWDCGTESNSDKAKGEASDAFKRAAVKWGVGRFLYDVPVQYVKSNEPKKDNNYPYPVDEEGNKIKNLSDYINQREKVLVFQSRTKRFDKAPAPVPLQPETQNDTVAQIKINEDEIEAETIQEILEGSKIGKIISDTLICANDEKLLLKFTKELIETYGISKDDKFLKNRFNYNKNRINRTNKFFLNLKSLKQFSDLSTQINELITDYPEIKDKFSFFIDIIKKSNFNSKVDLEALRVLCKKANDTVVKNQEFVEALKAKRVE